MCRGPWPAAPKTTVVLAAAEPHQSNLLWYQALYGARGALLPSGGVVEYCGAFLITFLFMSCCHA